MNPPASLFEIFIISNFHFFFEQTFSYILNKSEQKSDASTPPVPARISTIAFLSSSLSFGNRNYLEGINVVGLRRKNVSNKEIMTLLEAYKEIFATKNINENNI